MSNHDEDYEMIPIKKYTYFYNDDIMITDETYKILKEHNVSFGVNDCENIINNTIIIVGLLDDSTYPHLDKDFTQLLINYGKYICDYSLKHPHDSGSIVFFLQNIRNQPDLLQITLDYYCNMITKNFSTSSKQCVYHLFKNTDLCPKDLLYLALSEIAIQDTYKYVVVAYDKKDKALIAELVVRIIEANYMDEFVNYLMELNGYRVYTNRGAIDLAEIYNSLPPKYDLWKLGVFV